MTQQLCRNVFRDISDCTHAGLLLSRGLLYYPDKSKAAKEKENLIERICQLRPDDTYRQAFNRWKLATASSSFSTLTATLQGRLYIGVTRENALEAGVTVHHIYGMPLIPGSSVKGLCRAYAASVKINAELYQWLFGASADDVTGSQQSESGGVQFYDAMWIPNIEKPFVPEIITTHHSDYYSSYGEQAATDFDSPIPAPQIAVVGDFYFAIQGDVQATALVATLLQQALESWGIGSKRSSGYGIFKNFRLISALQRVQENNNVLPKKQHNGKPRK